MNKQASELQQAKLSDLIPDYLNGHLSTVDATAVEAHMGADKDFAHQVNTERKLLELVRGRESEELLSQDISIAPRAQFSFYPLRQQIQQPPSDLPRWWQKFTANGFGSGQSNWIAPAAFAAFALLAIPLMYNGSFSNGAGQSSGFETQPSPSAAPGIYETLTQPDAKYDQAVLRVVAISGSDLLELRTEYGLEVLADYEGAATMDVKAGNDFELIMQRLQKDERVSLVRYIEVSADADHE